MSLYTNNNKQNVSIKEDFQILLNLNMKMSTSNCSSIMIGPCMTSKCSFDIYYSMLILYQWDKGESLTINLNVIDYNFLPQIQCIARVDLSYMN
jgi:hypothetical protein